MRTEFLCVSVLREHRDQGWLASCKRALKKGNRKVQGVPQSQTAAIARPEEEEETDIYKQAQIKQMYEKH